MGIDQFGSLFVIPCGLIPGPFLVLLLCSERPSPVGGLVPASLRDSSIASNLSLSSDSLPIRSMLLVLQLTSSMQLW